MEMTIEHQEYVRRQFDAFCKKALADEKKTWFSRRARHMKREVSLCDLSEEQAETLFKEDDYPSEHFHFDAKGYDVQVDNESLAAVLKEMPDENRTPLLLAYDAGMKDAEIARALNVPRSTVNYRRNTSLSTLKKGMTEADSAINGGECGNTHT